jgi:ureidoacrylate peracid hydrolase
MTANSSTKEWAFAEEFIKKTGRPAPLFQLDSAKTALVVIDMQNAFVAPGSTIEIPAGRQIVPNINKLARACRSVGIPVVWVVSKFRSEAEWGLITAFEPGSPIETSRETPMDQLRWGAEGTHLWRELEVDTGKDHEVVKCRYSAFVSGSSNLERLLRALGRDNIVMTGVATNVCVGTSAMDAMMLDLKVTVVSDATAAFTDFLQQAFLINLKMVFAEVMTTDEILKKLVKLQSPDGQ